MIAAAAAVAGMPYTTRAEGGRESGDKADDDEH